jgi:hypothetical protein
MTDTADIEFRSQLAAMLRQLADIVDRGDINEVCTRILTDLFIKFQFMNAVDPGNSTSASTSNQPAIEGPKRHVVNPNDDLLQFMALGWHIYSNLADDI